MGTPKISASDHVNGFQYAGDKPDNFVIDMSSFTGKDVPANPRINVSFILSSVQFFSGSLIFNA